jgi:hypothetical protein
MTVPPLLNTPCVRRLVSTEMVPLLVKAPCVCRPAMASTWSAPELTTAWPPPPFISTLRSSDRVSQHRVAVPRALPTPPAPPPLSPAAAGLPETGMLSIASLSIEIVSETIDGLAA